jgi:4-amino-4-deoxy-L-arabinose transferase-like glycosyltransferase
VLQVGSAALPDIYDELPGQYAAPARAMVESGDWLIPHLNGVPRLQKPPLVYWLTALSLATLGLHEFAARLPTALALLALTLVTYAVGVRLYGPARATVAAAILGSALGTVALGKLIMPEPFLALGIALTLLAALRAADDPARGGRWALAAWGAAALATLSKGPHGLLLPGTILAAAALVSREARPRLRVLLRPAGPLLYLLLVLPWPLYVESRFPGYLADNFWNEQVGHLLDTHQPRDSEPTALGLFWAQHLFWWFPWVLFVPAALASVGAASGTRSHGLSRLPLAWLVVSALAASLSGQRQDYHTMYAWPAFALLASRPWDPRARPPRAWLAAPLAVLAAMGLLALLALPAVGRIVTASGASAPFGARNSVVGVLTGVAAAEWVRLSGLLWPVGLGLLGAGLGGLVLVLRTATRPWAWLAVAAGMAGPLTAAVLGLQAFAPLYSLKALARALPSAGPDTLVVYDGPSHRASSLAFYATAPVRWLAPPESEFAVRATGRGRERFVTEREVEARWRAGRPVWLITEESRLETWRYRLGELGPVVARSGTRVLIRSPATSPRRAGTRDGVGASSQKDRPLDS